MKPMKHWRALFFHHHENIPEQNEEIVIPPFTITALLVKDNRIEQVRLKIEREKE